MSEDRILKSIHMSEMRLQKFLAEEGYASRRKSEELIREGFVYVNDKKVTDMGVKIVPAVDSIRVDVTGAVKQGYEVHEPLKEEDKSKVYIALNKPIDYICSTTDEQGESVLSLLTTRNQMGSRKKELHARVYPVGRLDKDSEGLVLLTNDGELTNQLTHPKFEHEKEYEVTIAGHFDKKVVKALEHGMDIGEGEYAKGIEVKNVFNAGKRTIITVVLTEGKNRQIRRMFGRLGYDIIGLKRIRIGQLNLGTVPQGKWRYVRREWVM